MNFKKLMLIVVPLVLLIVGYQYFTRIDHTDARQVATAFTKALRGGNVDDASEYVVPAGAEAWLEKVGKLKSGARERLRERLPASPTFDAPTTSAAGVTTVTTTDKSLTLPMQQVDGKWYVVSVPL